MTATIIQTEEITTLFCDASFDWTKTEKSDDPVVYGRICVADGKGWSVVEKVMVGKVPNLKQYINIFELTAVARAIELAITKGFKGSLRINSDSRTACAWAFSGINPKVKTEAHATAHAYYKNMKAQHGDVFVGFVEREKNPAGHVLEELLDKEKGK